MVTAGGNLKWIDMWSKTISFMGRSADMVTMIDITERKQAEEALRESKEFSENLIASMNDGFSVLDAQGVHLDVNESFCRITGFAREELIGSAPPHAYWPEEEYQNIEKAFQMTLEGKSVEFELIFKRKNGERFPVIVSPSELRDGKGNIANYFATVKDITERKRAEDEIQRFKTIFAHANFGNAISDLKGELVYINRYFAEIHGYSPEELIGQNLSTFHSEKHLKAANEINESLKQSGSFGPLEVWHKHKDGTEFPMLMNGIVLKDKNGEPQYLAASAIDITETTRLRELESRAGRLEMAGTIAGQVAHDFNNLLGPIMAYPELIREELPHDHRAMAYLEDIENAARKIADINQDLLTMGRRGHFSQEILDLNQLVLNIVKEKESNNKLTIFETVLSNSLMSIKGGEAQIHRMITNLFNNAQDAMQNIGQITIKTENYYADDTSIAYGIVPKGEYVKLTITDNGCGIDESIIQKILDPFFSTKTADKKRGSGLGLSVVDTVINDHNGYLDLSSKLGEGTSFYLYFPMVRESVKKTKDEVLKALEGSESILVVDDDEIQRDVTTRLLEKLGYDVESVASGEEAVEFIKKRPQDLIILDMIMIPGIDGTETYRRILNIYPHQRAIVVSGFSETDRIIEVQKLGAGEFVKKPITINSLATAIRSELNREIEDTSVLENKE